MSRIQIETMEMPIREHSPPFRGIILARITVLMVLLSGRESSATNPRDRAHAAVAVARAALENAADRPALPDKPRSMSLSSNVASSTAIERQQSARGNTLDAHKFEWADPTSLRSMRLEFSDLQPISESLPAQLEIGVWEQGCPVCVRLEKELKTILIPLGWTVGHDTCDQIRIVVLPSSVPAPQIRLYQNGNIARKWNQYVDPGTLSQTLRRAWDTAPPLVQASNSRLQSGAAGTIHAASQIRAAMIWWREHLGERNKGSLIWDRSGAQTFPLLAKSDWSATALFGTTGHIDLAMDDAARTPLKAMGFGYQIRGADMIVDADPLTLTGLADRLSSLTPAGTDRPQIVSFVDPLTAWSIFSMFQGIYELLRPTCDLQLPEQIAAQAELLGDTLSIEFQQGPSIKLVALFTFHLKLQRIEITETSVRLVFTGSRLIRERTFTVK